VAGPLTTGLVVGPAHEGLVACPLLVPFQGLPCARANNGAMSLTACVSARAARWPASGAKGVVPPSITHPPSMLYVMSH
jgi:hypothetical protein